MTNEITAEEAVKILRFEQEQVEHRLDGCSDTQENRNIYEAFSMAIKALEQEPSEDCISRQAVIDTICEDVVSDSSLIDRINNLPPVTPKYTDEEIDRAQAVEQAYVDKMVELAVEETERPKGKWIKIQSGDKDFPESIVCSRCKNENSHLDFDEHNEPIGKVFVTSKYCPDCGAEMGGEDETNN